MAASDCAAPVDCWANSAMPAAPVASARNGTFSTSSRRHPVRCAGGRRRSGQRSISSSSAGSVIPIALASRLTAYSPTASAYHARRTLGDPPRTYRTYPHIAPSSGGVLSTSRRSVIQATDSTCIGWTTNTAATVAAQPTAPVASARNRNRITPAAACSATFSTCITPGSSPHHAWSSR
jgi:hypothetical protein